MKIKVLGCFGGQLPGCNNSAYLLDNDTLIDAGTIALKLPIKDQQKIKTILISHPHLDHIGALPFYGVNIVSNISKPVQITGGDFTINAMKKYLMNGIIWPDFTKINNFGGHNVFAYSKIKISKWNKVSRYTVKPVPVNHTVPANGFIIGKNNRYLLYTGDTKQTNAIWKEAKKLGTRLKSIMIEVAYPDGLAKLAENSGHLVPKTMELELKKLGNKARPRIFIMHIKPEYLGRIKKELKAIKGYNITVMQEGKIYTV